MAAYDITVNAALEFDTTFAIVSSVISITTGRIMIAWPRSNTIFNVQCFNVNPTTKAVTAVGSPLNLGANYAYQGRMPSLVKIDSSNAVVIYATANTEMRAQLISVDGSGNCSANGSAVDVDAGSSNASAYAYLIDSTHVAYGGMFAGAAHAYWNTLNIDTATPSITINTAVDIYPAGSANGSPLLSLSSSKVIGLIADSDLDLRAIVASLDGSYNLSVTTSQEIMNNTSVYQRDVFLVDTSASPILGFTMHGNNANAQLRPISINTTTWVVSGYGTPTSFSYGGAFQQSGGYVKKIDSTHAIAWGPVSGDPTAWIITFDSGAGTFSVSSPVTIDSGGTLSTNNQGQLCQISAGQYACTFAGGGNDGFVRILDVELPPPPPSVFTPAPMPNFIAE